MARRLTGSRCTHLIQVAVHLCTRLVQRLERRAAQLKLAARLQSHALPRLRYQRKTAHEVGRSSGLHVAKQGRGQQVTVREAGVGARVAAPAYLQHPHTCVSPMMLPSSMMGSQPNRSWMRVSSAAICS